MKDWDHYRQVFIEDTLINMNKLLSHIETLTPIEKIMALELYRARDSYGEQNFSVATQHKIGTYTVDFYIDYSSPSDSDAKKIIIECDGHDFHEKTKEQASKDKQRDRFFTTGGYIVLRYTGSDIVNNPSSVHRDLCDIILQG